MASMIHITPEQPVVATISTTGDTRENLWDAVDVGAYDFLDLELVITAITGAATVTIGLCTGNHIESEDGWLSNTSTPSLNFYPAGVGSQQKTFGCGLLRYVRWVVQPNATAGTVTFYIRGMARKQGGA
jgi:hypothetical protein